LGDNEGFYDDLLFIERSEHLEEELWGSGSGSLLDITFSFLISDKPKRKIDFKVLFILVCHAAVLTT
jgi:hypothetical protein